VTKRFISRITGRSGGCWFGAADYAAQPHFARLRAAKEQRAASPTSIGHQSNLVWSCDSLFLSRVNNIVHRHERMQSRWTARVTSCQQWTRCCPGSACSPRYRTLLLTQGVSRRNVAVRHCSQSRSARQTTFVVPPREHVFRTSYAETSTRFKQ